MRFVGIALLLLLAATARGGRGRLYVTDFGRRILGQTDQIVEARVAEIKGAFRGITTAHLRVEKRLSGFDREKELLLLYVEDFTAPDAFGSSLEASTIQFERRRKEGLLRYMRGGGSTDSSTATSKVTRRQEDDGVTGAPVPENDGVRLAKGERGIFFLRRKGASYSMVGYVPARDPLYEVKKERLVAVLQLESIPTIAVRVKDAKFFYMRGLDSKHPWKRGNSAREVMALAIRYPEVYSRGETRRLVSLLHGEKEPPVAASLERAVRVLDPAAGLAYAEEAEARERKRIQGLLDRARIRIDSLRNDDLKAVDVERLGERCGRAGSVLISLYLTDPSPVVRERAARALAEHGGPSARLPLREALAEEKDPGVSRALVFACGASGDPVAVPLLAARLGDPNLERPALYALAAIGTPQARYVVRQHRPRATEAVRSLVDTLLRDEFTR